MKTLWTLLLVLFPLQPVKSGINNHFLARITFYTSKEDRWSAKGLTSTGHKLEVGVCAVDPLVIGYGKKVVVPGVGIYEAWDTGSAVISREAAKKSAKNYDEFRAVVVDIFTTHPEKYRNYPEFVDCWIAP